MALSTTIKSADSIIIPKTRSEWIIRNDNSNYESSLTNLDNCIKNGIIYQGIHNKSGIVHIISGIPDINLSFYTIKFKATNQYTTGDTFEINGLSYAVKSSDIAFNTDSIVECNVDKINKFLYILNKPLLEPPYNPTVLPAFTYTGQYETVNDGELGWRIKFKSSGTFTLNDVSKLNIDVFCVGGGASGTGYYSAGGAGGGGGYTTTQKNIQIVKGTPYSIIVGTGGNTGKEPGQTAKNISECPPTNGGNSSAFNVSANGGNHGDTSSNNGNNYTEDMNYGYGGSGGSGGAGAGKYSGGTRGGGSGTMGGSDGSNGTKGGDGQQGSYGRTTGGGRGGYGQGRTTREFGETNATIYSGGGNSSPGKDYNGKIGGYQTTRPAGGGGAYCIYGHSEYPTLMNANFYGGGGAGGTGSPSWIGCPGNGFQGIVIIRNAR